MKFDWYGALMINCGNRILILFHVYCCRKHKLSMILIANVAYLSCFAHFNVKTFDSKHDSSFCAYFISLVLFMIGLLSLWETVSMNLAQ